MQQFSLSVLLLLAIATLSSGRELFDRFSYLRYATGQQQSPSGKQSPVIKPQPASDRQQGQYVSQALWDQWSAWSQCSTTCGAGNRRRTRSCRVGFCEGPRIEDTACSAGPCSYWHDWSAWSACSATCGQGQALRSRQCSTYVGCDGQRDERSVCQAVSCAQWSQWSQWGQCSQLCGSGTRNRTRTCTQYGACPGNAIEQSQCNIHPCCATWSAWSQCSQSCLPHGANADSAVQTRHKRCISASGTTLDSATGQYAGYASELQRDTRQCATGLNACPEWSPWSGWTACTVSCGGGSTRRNRACPSTGQCPGDAIENRRCSEQACPGWNQWGPWTTCSRSCGSDGVRTRVRQCDGGHGQCSGQNTESKSCNQFACPQWSPWAPWSHCDKPCGGGTQTRTRVCNQYVLCPGDRQEQRACNEHLCPMAGDWEEWGGCTQPCGYGKRQRRRPCLVDVDHCKNSNASLASCQCVGHMDDSQQCNGHSCAQWSAWSQWTQCSVLCGGGQRSRTRQCENDVTFCTGVNANHPSCLCQGNSVEDSVCGTADCPQWSEWGVWGDCSTSCGGGARERKRSCLTDYNYCTDDKRGVDEICTCPGLDHSNDQCNVQLCPIWDQWTPWSECDSQCNGGHAYRARQCLFDTDYCTNDRLSQRDVMCVCDGEELTTRECNGHACAIFEQWQAWTTCTVSCGGGMKSRKRACQRDASYCQGERLQLDQSCQCEVMNADDPRSEEEEACNAIVCSRWNEWSDWGECSASCGGGTRNRARTCYTDPILCATPEARSNPACQCEGDTQETGACNQHQCPVWSAWTAWTICSVSCGDGQRFRQRDCNTDALLCAAEHYDEIMTGDVSSSGSCRCEGSNTEAEYCENAPCYMWADWQPWAQCSHVCGGGSRNRARTCPQPSACPGLGSETEFCAQVPCPDWGEWGAWSSCSVTCNGGQRVRTRACPLEGGCTPGEAFETQQCGNDACPVWAQWGSWGSCSATCGEGVRVRGRACDGQGECLGRNEDFEQCFTAACQLNTFWSEWSPCTTTCGGGEKLRSRVTCPAVGCPTETDRAPCNQQQCPTWSTWGVWSDCTQTCGGGSRDRQRDCYDITGQLVSNGCVGKMREIDPQACNNFSCVQQGGFLGWLFS